MKKLIFTVLFAFSTLAFASGREEGGGDPDAAEFARLMAEVPGLIRKTPTLKKIVDADRFADLAKEFALSLNDDDSSNDLIEFTETPLVVGGTKKPALYNGKKAIVHRPTWLEYGRYGQTAKKRAITLLEGLLALGIRSNRYAGAGEMISIEPATVANYSLLGAGHSAKSFEQSCEITTRIEDRLTGQTHEVSVELAGQVIDWETAGQAFVLESFSEYKSDRKSFEAHPTLSKLSFTSELLPDQDDAVLISAESSLYSSLSGSKRLTTKYLMRAIDDSTSEQWSWSGDRASEALLSTKTVHLDDGSTMIIKEDLNKLATAGAKTKSYVKSCTRRPVSSSEIKDLKLALKIKNFGLAVDKVNRLNLAYALCLEKKSEDCELLEKAHARAKAESLKLWSQIEP